MSAGMCQKIFRFIKRPNLESFGREQVLHRLKDREIIIDQTDFVWFRLGWIV